MTMSVLKNKQIFILIEHLNQCLKNIYLRVPWIGYFRVQRTLTFKARLGAKPFLWTWVLFAGELQEIIVMMIIIIIIINNNNNNNNNNN